MIRTTTRSVTVAATALALLATVTPAALAKNGGRTENAPTPPPTATTPAPTVVDCSDPRITSLTDVDTLVINQAGNAGCIAVRINANGSFSLAAAALTAGWSYDAKSSSTGGDRVKLDLTNGRDEITFLVEPGKTWIR